MQISIFRKVPDEYVTQLQRVHEAVLGDELAEDGLYDLPNMLVLLAIEDGRVVGFKIGYDIEDRVFYSWIGGVDPTFRRNGIAMQLIERQHEELKQLGYTAVRTYSRNELKEMLIVNLKAGFDIVDTFTDHKGRHKIMLEKCL
ncbi:MAG: GNAT family N-acetyltransferase [Caryophanon sp.]|nr:GNAT family N-acetyltransferase [Caryophanon sp.]